MLARAYGVTSDAASVRVGWLKLAPWDRSTRCEARIGKRGRPREPGGGGNYYRNVVARFGPGLTGRILSAVDQGVLSDLAAARVLDTRSALSKGCALS